MAHVPDFKGSWRDWRRRFPGPRASRSSKRPWSCATVVEKIEFDTIYPTIVLLLLRVGGGRRGTPARAGARARRSASWVLGASLRLFLLEQVRSTGARRARRCRAKRPRQASRHTGSSLRGLRPRHVRRYAPTCARARARLRAPDASIAGYVSPQRASITAAELLRPHQSSYRLRRRPRNPHEARYRRMPGCGIPIVGAEAITERRPGNRAAVRVEHQGRVMQQEDAYRRAGGRFIVRRPVGQVQ